MKISQAELERLRFSGKKFRKYALSRLCYFPEKLLEDSKWIKLVIGFEERILADKFLSYCEKLSRYNNVVLRSYKTENEFIVEILAFSENSYLLPEFLSSKWFHLSSFVLLEREREDGKVEKFGDGESVRRGLTRNLSIVEMPYKSRISIERKELERIGNVLKHLLLQYFGLEETELYGPLKLLSVDCLRRYLGYEQLSEDETHIRWRIEGRKLLANTMLELEEILKEIILNDGFAIYPKLSRSYMVDGKKVELQDRLVVEADPRSSSFENAKKVIEVVNDVLEEKRIDRAILFSGSKSYRLHIPLRVEEILGSLDELLEEFPYIGIFSQKSLQEMDEREKYRLLLKALSKALYVESGLKMRREKEKVKFTSNKFYFDVNAVLLDFPTSVSIASGSPKYLMKAEEAKKYGIKLRRLEKIGYIPLCCIPVDGFYSKEEVYRLSNIFSAAEIAERSWKDYEERMKRGIGVEEMRRILDVEDSFLRNLQMKGEYWFLSRVVQA